MKFNKSTVRDVLSMGTGGGTMSSAGMSWARGSTKVGKGREGGEGEAGAEDESLLRVQRQRMHEML